MHWTRQYWHKFGKSLEKVSSNTSNFFAHLMVYSYFLWSLQCSSYNVIINLSKWHTIILVIALKERKCSMCECHIFFMLHMNSIWDTKIRMFLIFAPTVTLTVIFFNYLLLVICTNIEYKNTQCPPSSSR